MVVIQKDYVSMLLLGDLFSEKHKTEERIEFYKKKYKTDISSFKSQVFEGDENFEYYDDYLEWKAYVNSLKDINRKINEIKDGNFQIA
ncbi:hypothetical protein [Desulfonatronum thiodismutans]|uniref:hypothetical protein n=1 Tax=Desulfonatronum thiodismutans TaxID=159290 RepID=UPI0004ABE5EE|nr:hypothetical protein [Desulfonatronum thiodismutans]